MKPYIQFRKLPPITVATFLAFTALSATSTQLSKESAVPGLDAAGQQAYRNFRSAPLHRAFAIAPGGYWSWQADFASADAASSAALHACHELVGHACELYASDEHVVLDVAKWQQQWRPYLNQAEAGRAGIGNQRGQRFYDLKLKDGRGKESSVSALQGKVLILHFWGSWCPSCRTELPDLAKLQHLIARKKDVRLVLLQVREDFQKGKNWVKEQGLKLPLFDSGMQRSKDDTFRMHDGSTIKDREIAPVFPSTYVLDKNGVVVFSHVGTLADWPGYLPLLQDVARQTGKAISRPLPNR